MGSLGLEMQKGVTLDLERVTLDQPGFHDFLNDGEVFRQADSTTRTVLSRPTKPYLYFLAGAKFEKVNLAVSGQV